MADFTLTGFSTTAQTLTGSETGILTDADANLVVNGDAITSSGSFNNLSINGSVIASTLVNNNAIEHDGGTFTAFVGPSGYVNSIEGDTFFLSGTSTMRIQNTGTILAGADAIDARASDGGAPIDIINSGTIIGESDGLVLDGGTANVTIVNSGTIEGGSGGIFSNFFSGSIGTTILRNSGTISGGTSFAYTSELGGGVDRIFNSGVMNGDVEMGVGDDRLDNTGGVINGTVFGDFGNDTLAGGENADDFNGGADADTIVGRGGDDLLDGEGGDDFILGGAGNDDIEGGSENDTINGNAGDDTILGDSGNDILVGQDGSDFLDGSDGLDTMDGGNGDDILEGGADNDILRGRAGEDELAGGLGRDFLTGGQDADVFVFRSTAETVVGANRDQILDFEQGLDLITVAGLSPGVFEFRGTSAFDPSGNPELRLFETATGSTIVQIDTDGDGTQDAEIRVANVTGLTADDFVL
ncbi:Hemolysin-type calcium-binding repeat-containing protein [Mameliella alba]|uniref:calcium-binding protein n=1 Tax=Mameliella alba TaxID=561184 RepID=UPI00088C49A3|nr:calcium-binding protein [Mameliella alba]OWV47459.1 hypothetical protein CDZ96_13345 [Mameliella alba]PTR38319.1 hemolysin type calcium-binding protein [Mameliella alba]GGF58261.1 hypothetical protein GCM10011319_19440 [Mameliella alba]SDC80868.1 Hemolysin-type calcium-binding repeat-containing protein [Mameliella alba]